ncbi:MAG: peptide chain release factor 2, partial [Gammaproteobacteria bacterium]
MTEVAPIREKITDLKSRVEALRGYLDYAGAVDRLSEVERMLEDPGVWSEPERAQNLGREQARLAELATTLDGVADGFDDAGQLLELAAGEDDAAAVAEVEADVAALERKLAALEFRRMFHGEMDAANAFLDVQSGSGGTEAQDWAEMLLRMYLRWGERRGFATELIEVSPGEVAGIKSATIRFEGDYAYGWLRTETGVHRLVRKSPFDSGHRRHTSFAAVFAAPEVDDDIEIDINPADLRVDVYRASGAGGQHVKRTESAVRITHLSTGIVVQCQYERSQHKNRARAMSLLSAKLLAEERNKQIAEQSESRRLQVGSGDRSERIRTYNYPQGRVTDHRINLTLYKLETIL